jgi:hypothetical protein
MNRMARKDATRRDACTALLVALLALGALQPAHAYVDPGTGAMMVQLAAAALAGVAFYFRAFRDWLAGLFRRDRAHAARATDAAIDTTDDR